MAKPEDDEQFCAEVKGHFFQGVKDTDQSYIMQWFHWNFDILYGYEDDALAVAVGVDRGTVTKWRLGRQPISSVNILKLRMAFYARALEKQKQGTLPIEPWKLDWTLYEASTEDLMIGGYIRALSWAASRLDKLIDREQFLFFFQLAQDSEWKKAYELDDRRKQLEILGKLTDIREPQANVRDLEVARGLYAAWRGPWEDVLQCLL